MIKLPIEIGDILLVGRFKNKRIKVKEIGTDEHGLPTVNGRGILKIRIEKLMEPKKNLKESTLYPELQKGSKIKVRKDDRSGIFIDGVVTDRKGNYISYKTSMGFGGINLEAKNLGDTIQFDSLKENMKKNLKEDTKVNLTYICINDGTVQTTRGEVRSAEIRKGDIIKVTRENDYFYFGTPQIKGQFRHDPGLSGRRTNNTPVNANDVEVAISKKNSMTSDPHDFWATFKIQSNESKQFKLAQTAKRILKEEGFNKDGNPYGFEYDEDADYENLELSDGETTVELYKDGSKWIEGRVIDGEKPYGWGSKTYQSYLSIDDICTWLKRDYGGSWELINAE
jgi:hypothetical protein